MIVAGRLHFEMVKHESPQVQHLPIWQKTFKILLGFSVADPGFPVGGGADPLGGGAPTSDAYTFR